jgi:hypothetical protein
MALETIQTRLVETFDSSVFESSKKEIYFHLKLLLITAVILFLKKHSTLRFHFLTDLWNSLSRQ